MRIVLVLFFKSAGGACYYEPISLLSSRGDIRRWDSSCRLRHWSPREAAVAKSAIPQQTSDIDKPWRIWWANVPVPESLPAGTVLRIDMMPMIGDAEAWTQSSAQSLFEKVCETLDELLAGNATYWSLAPGLVDIHYGTLKKQAAELKHSVVASAVERCVRAALENANGSSEGGKAAVVRRVDWDKFEAICAKAKARTDQVQILDVSEALFGTPEPDLTLSLRIW